MLSYRESDINSKDGYTPKQLAEIKRVNSITRASFSKTLPSLFFRNKEKVQGIVYAMVEEIYRDTEVCITGEENILETPAIYIPNHYSWSKDNFLWPGFLNYDPPKPFLFLENYLYNEGLASRGITDESKVPFISGLTKALNYIQIPHRSDKKIPLTKDQRDYLNDEVRTTLRSESLIVFPEGNSYGEGNIGPFHPGVFHIAQQNNVPLIPVGMKGFVAGSRSMEMEFGSPIDVSDSEDVSPREFVELVRQKVFVDRFGFQPVSKRA